MPSIKCRLSVNELSISKTEISRNRLWLAYLHAIPFKTTSDWLFSDTFQSRWWLAESSSINPTRNWFGFRTVALYIKMSVSVLSLSSSENIPLAGSSLRCAFHAFMATSCFPRRTLQISRELGDRAIEAQVRFICLLRVGFL